MRQNASTEQNNNQKMTNLKDWVEGVELDASKDSNEPNKLYDAISTQKGNEKFFVTTKIEDGQNVDVITKNGFKPELEIKSPIARTRILSDIKNDYLPLTKLK